MTTQWQRNDVDFDCTAALFTLSPRDQVGALPAPANQDRVLASEEALLSPELSGGRISTSGPTRPMVSVEGPVALSLWGQLLQDRLRDVTWPLNVFSVGVLISGTLSSSDLQSSGRLDPRQKTLRDRVLDSIVAEPVEDGYRHSAEEILEQAINSDADSAATWIRLLILDRRKPALAAAVLRCLGRLDNPLTEEWRASLVEAALASPDVEVRDAAAQAAELWNDERSYEVLRQHNETEPWLRAYIEEVLHGVMK